MQRTFILLGLVILLVGLAWPWLSKLPFGRLPGDLIFDKPGLKVFIPITTMLLFSAAVSLVTWLFRR
jgi:Protein of unknown function (DUF2905)